jgi:membrane-associated phospholipid phosphatase
MIKIKEIFTYPGMILYYLFLLVGSTILFWSEKGEGVVWLNQFGNDFLDLFFIFWTYLGDGVVFGLLIVFFFFRSYFFLLVTLLTVVIQTIFVQGLKLLVFPDLDRPKLFFENFMELRQIVGIDIHAYHAFPSGHTATAFSTALILSFFLSNKKWSLLLILVAIGVGLSRMYLLQHFFVDIYFGSFFGVISTLISLYLLGFRKSLYPDLLDRSVLNRR